MFKLGGWSGHLEKKSEKFYPIKIFITFFTHKNWKFINIILN